MHCWRRILQKSDLFIGVMQMYGGLTPYWQWRYFVIEVQLRSLLRNNIFQRNLVVTSVIYCGLSVRLASNRSYVLSLVHGKNLARSRSSCFSFATALAYRSTTNQPSAVKEIILKSYMLKISTGYLTCMKAQTATSKLCGHVVTICRDI